MAFGHIYCFIMCLKLLLLLNCSWLCKANFTSADISVLSKMLLPFENLTSLPINYPLTDEEISNYTQEYESGLDNEDIYLSGTQLIQKYGYKVEEHHVVTSDGYNLSMFRIPSDGPKVFVMHGLFASYLDWLTIGPDKCLPFKLANKGYDVWLGNARCNTITKENINPASSKSNYCDISWDEIGRLDLPAMIDYILDSTRTANLTYIGHSQGTTSFFVMCSELLEYNKKINFMIALSAVAWMKHAVSPLLQIAAPASNILLLDRAIGITNIPNNHVTKTITRAFCGNSFLAPTICSNVEFLFCGFDYAQIDYKQSPVIFNHTPSSSSLKQVQHYGQLVVSGDFRRFDYGPLLNPAKYGSITPPPYPVEKITVPVAIFHSCGDWLASPKDVNVLCQKLQNLVENRKVSLSTFNHDDYLWAKDVDTLVYKRVLELIEENVVRYNVSR